MVSLLPSSLSLFICCCTVASWKLRSGHIVAAKVYAHSPRSAPSLPVVVGVSGGCHVGHLRQQRRRRRHSGGDMSYFDGVDARRLILTLACLRCSGFTQCCSCLHLGEWLLHVAGGFTDQSTACPLHLFALPESAMVSCMCIGRLWLCVRCLLRARNGGEQRHLDPAHCWKGMDEPSTQLELAAEARRCE